MSLDDTEKIFHHSFYTELRVSPEETIVVVTVPVWSSASFKEKLTQLMFETFTVPAFLAVNQATLVALAHKLPTGLVVLLGELAGFVVPVHEARAMEEFAMNLPFGGRHLSDYFIALLQNEGIETATYSDREVARDMKEKLCYVVQEPISQVPPPSLAKKYEFPDGSCVTATNACYLCPEALFDPSLLGVTSDPLPDLIVKTIHKCPETLHEYLKANVMLSGGTSLIPGLKGRIVTEIWRKYQTNISFVPSPKTHYHSWLGATVLTSLSSIVAPLLITDRKSVV